MNQRIWINEVGPRDGLQNQRVILPVEQRLSLIEALLAAGLTALEVGAFVSPRAVPQMADTDQLLPRLPAGAGRHYAVLVPNLKGYTLARDAQVEAVSVPVSVTDTMNLKNLRMNTAEIMAQTMDMIARGKADGIRVLVYLSVAFECPFEGRVSADTVLQLARQLMAADVDRLVIADTIGAAGPTEVRELMDALVGEFGSERLACHFHDTRALALANVFAAVESGIRHFDSSIAGLGGCPFAPGAAGNVATEDLAVLFDRLGFATEIDLERLLMAAELAAKLTRNPAAMGRSTPWLKGRIAEHRAGDKAAVN